MALFGKKDPCAICGGQVKGLLPHKIDKQLVCKDCYGNVDLPDDALKNMTVSDFKKYMEFRNQNDTLKKIFSATTEIDLGLFALKIVIDNANRFFCMDRELEKTVFEGKDIISFAIKEDMLTVYEGKAAGLSVYPSSVPQRIMDMTAQISHINMHRNLQNIASVLGADSNSDRSADQLEIPEPFSKFNIEIRVRHPYWELITASMSAPTINNEHPNLDDYMKEYNQSAALMEQLANALMEIAFPNAQQPQNASAAGNAADEILRFKVLLDQGIITEEEFTAKKRQLLGI